LRRASDLQRAAGSAAAVPLVGSSRVAGPYHRSGIAPCPESSAAESTTPRAWRRPDAPAGVCAAVPGLARPAPSQVGRACRASNPTASAVDMRRTQGDNPLAPDIGHETAVQVRAMHAHGSGDKNPCVRRKGGVATPVPIAAPATRMRRQPVTSPLGCRDRDGRRHEGDDHRGGSAGRPRVDRQRGALSPWRRQPAALWGCRQGAPRSCRRHGDERRTSYPPSARIPGVVAWQATRTSQVTRTPLASVWLGRRQRSRQPPWPAPPSNTGRSAG
jgi:hypothetical protein